MYDDQTRRVVVGYDGSTQARSALDWAADEALRRKAALTVIFAVDHYGLVSGSMTTSARLPSLAADAAQLVADEGADRVRQRSSVEVTAQTISGSPARVLVAASAGADLLVVGTRGHGDLAACVLGSVASAVCTHASCPVVIVRGDGTTAPGPDKPVVVGVDGSAAAAAALRFAAETAARTSAPLKIVCAWKPLTLDGWTGAYWLSLYPDQDPQETARIAAEQMANAAVDSVRHMDLGITVTSHVRTGVPAEVILAVAESAGLVVIGARGRGSFTSFLLGSVSHGVVHGASCPVTVIRAGDPVQPAQPLVVEKESVHTPAHP